MLSGYNRDTLIKDVEAVWNGDTVLAVRALPSSPSRPPGAPRSARNRHAPIPPAA